MARATGPYPLSGEWLCGRAFKIFEKGGIGKGGMGTVYKAKINPAQFMLQRILMGQDDSSKFYIDGFDHEHQDPEILQQLQDHANTLEAALNDSKKTSEELDMMLKEKIDTDISSRNLICALKVLDTSQFEFVDEEKAEESRQKGERQKEKKQTPDKTVERFFMEATLAGKLKHTNITSSFGLFQDEDLLIMAMEYVDAHIKFHKITKPYVPEVVLQVGEGVLNGLAYAHNSRGVIHRDIKPGNIMIDKNGVVKILDFGLAKVVEEGLLGASMEEGGVPLTKSGTVMGTPHYMPPEQAHGKKADRKADIYSLGVTLYHLVAGYVPFDDTAPLRILGKICRDPPRELPEDVPPDLRRVIKRFIVKDPEKRPSAEQALELIRFAKGEQRSLDASLQEMLDEERINQDLQPLQEDILQTPPSTRVFSGLTRLPGEGFVSGETPPPRSITEAQTQDYGTTGPLPEPRKPYKKLAVIGGGLAAIVVAIFGWRAYSHGQTIDALQELRQKAKADVAAAVEENAQSNLSTIIAQANKKMRYLSNEETVVFEQTFTEARAIGNIDQALDKAEAAIAEKKYPEAEQQLETARGHLATSNELFDKELQPLYTLLVKRETATTSLLSEKKKVQELEGILADITTKLDEKNYPEAQTLIEKATQKREELPENPAYQTYQDQLADKIKQVQPKMKAIQDFRTLTSSMNSSNTVYASLDAKLKKKETFAEKDIQGLQEGLELPRDLLGRVQLHRDAINDEQYNKKRAELNTLTENTRKLYTRNFEFVLVPLEVRYKSYNDTNDLVAEGEINKLKQEKQNLLQRMNTVREEMGTPPYAMLTTRLNAMDTDIILARNRKIIVERFTGTFLQETYDADKAKTYFLKLTQEERKTYSSHVQLYQLEQQLADPKAPNALHKTAADLYKDLGNETRAADHYKQYIPPKLPTPEDTPKPEGQAKKPEEQPKKPEDPLEQPEPARPQGL